MCVLFFAFRVKNLKFSYPLLSSFPIVCISNFDVDGKCLRNNSACVQNIERFWFPHGNPLHNLWWAMRVTSSMFTVLISVNVCSNPTALTVCALLICFSGVLSVLGNGILLFVAYRKKSSLKPAEFFVVNLAISDLSMTITLFPLATPSAYAHM